MIYHYIYLYDFSEKKGISKRLLKKFNLNFFAHCQFKDHPHCAFCGEDHESNDCLKDSGKKCENSAWTNCVDTHDEASSKQCPVYFDALKSSKISLNWTLHMLEVVMTG